MRALVFDLGGPLVTETHQLPPVVAGLGAQPPAGHQAYWETRLGYDAGTTSEVDYWSGVAGRPVEQAEAEELGRQDAAYWTSIRPEAEQLLREVRATGTPLWVLSNAPALIEPAIDAAGWRSQVSGRFVSGVLGLLKPDEAIYAHVEQELGLPGSELAFIDDRPANLDAAAAHGWTTHLYVDDADTRAWLVELGVLPG
ncbi:HAD family phosphatase [Luteococcus peritonei]|uniref:HAD family phosphatase n=1 Tax=Luteococcus peritonei TaxID=88874 RepID=A0ABW4RZ06_9ACTN